MLTLWKVKLTFAKLVVISMILGVLSGILFGERCGILLPVGKLYIALLQMCVLPYIIVSIIHGIGRLGIKESKILAVKGITLAFIFWGFIAIYIVLTPLCFPEWQPAMFFSQNTISAGNEIDYFKLYIPSNPFYSLTNNLVPAVTVFCICIGIAFIHIKEKKGILDALGTCRIALGKINSAIVALTPIGTFALLANMAGTITLDQISHMQVYLVTYVVMGLLLGFCVFPLLVSSFTKFTYRDILHVSKNAILTALATGNSFVLIPIISNDVKQLLQDKQLKTEDRNMMIDTAVPISYNLPMGGQMLYLLFIPFAAWFYGQNLFVWDYPQLIGVGLLSLFGSSLNAIILLLNYFHIPNDILNLFTAFMFLTTRVGVLLNGVFMISLAIMCTAWSTGFLKINLRKFIINISIMAIATVLALIACAGYFKCTSGVSYSKEILAEMKVGGKIPTKVFPEYPTPDQIPPAIVPHGNRLDYIKKRGVLRVGYSRTARPYSYLNSEGVLEGHDIAMAKLLAGDLGCSVEFIPIQYDDIAKGLSDGVVDIIMAGISITTKRIKSLYFTDSYMTVHLAFVVKDYEQEEYMSAEKIREKTKQRIANIKGFSYRKHIEKYYPNLHLVDIKAEKDFFNGTVDADALLLTAEEGYAWCLVYPAYCVAIPYPQILTEDLAYAISQEDLNFCHYLNTWLQIKKTDGTLKKLYDYWIMGENITKKEKRWCVWDKLFD